MKHTLILTALVIAPLAAVHAADAPTPCGDRNLPINQVYPSDAFYHNGNGGRVLDVTKPPFNAKGDGKTDDTKVLCAAMRFVADSYEPLVGNGWSYCGCTRLEVLGGTYHNFSKWDKGSMIFSRDSQVTALFVVFAGGIHQPNVLEAVVGKETTHVPLWQFPFLDKKTPPAPGCRNGKFVVSLFSTPSAQTNTNRNK